MKQKLAIVTVLCITLLEAIALMNGINGTYFVLVIAALAGGTGLIIPRPGFLKE